MLLEGLLKNFRLKFIIKPANITEYILNDSKDFARYVKRLSYDKALKICKLYPESIVIAADTIVVQNGKVFGKPAGKVEAMKMLGSLNNKWHKVFSGICILKNDVDFKYSVHEVTDVKFRRLMKEEIEFYVRSGSPFDKAGAYGIQDDFGCTFVEKIRGDYFNVVGLPLLKTYLGLRKILNLSV